MFFKFGPGPQSTGGGFSWHDYNFAVLPGFNTYVCGYQNIGELAHELGHYLGLSHPFAMIFNSVQDAQAYLSAHGNLPGIFDGDGLSDTPPDPYIDTPQFQCDPSVQSVTLNGQVFPLPRKNIMSYYSNGRNIDRTELTPNKATSFAGLWSSGRKTGWRRRPIITFLVRSNSPPWGSRKKAILIRACKTCLLGASSFGVEISSCSALRSWAARLSSLFPSPQMENTTSTFTQQWHRTLEKYKHS